MIPQTIDRKSLKLEIHKILKSAQVSPRGMTALYILLLLALDMVSLISGGSGILSTFINVLISLMSTVLAAGFALYCMAVLRGERAEYLTLFDGFSFVGRLIGLSILMNLFIGLWSMLFVIPGLIAAYRYRFALFNLYENPNIGILEALAMSQRQTAGYKGQLLLLDLSYLGWTLLASLPSLIQSAMVYHAMFQNLSAYLHSPTMAIPPLDTSVVLFLPDWAWTLLSGLWLLAVATFYLPHYICAEVSYFETAKATSGIRPNATPSAPDGLGGM